MKGTTQRQRSAGIRGALVGAAAFVFGYLVTWILAGTAVANSVVSGPFGGGVPDWKVLSWVFYDSHFVGTRTPEVFGPSGALWGGGDLVDTVGLFGVEYLFAVPVILLLVAGGKVATLSEAANPREGALLGLSIVVGYRDRGGPRVSGDRRCPRLLAERQRVRDARTDLNATDTLIQSCPIISDTMMLPTHALAGMALALPVAFVAPELSGVAFLAGLLGGSFPDFDMYVGHRKTLHYPVYYTAVAAPTVALAVALPGVWTVFGAVFLVGAAVHSLVDVLGGGLELRPWEGTSDRAVYDHYRERWIAPRQWISYDGSPGDLLCSYALAVPLLLAVGGIFQWAVIAALGVASVYAAVRRYLPRLAVAVLEVAGPWLPAAVLSALPSRYREVQPEPVGVSASD